MSIIIGGSPTCRDVPLLGNLVVSKAREYIGTPYYHSGRTKVGGVDCAGLVIAVFGELGVTITDTPDHYGRIVSTRQLMRTVRDNLTQVVGGLKEAKAGDVLTIRFKRHAQHLAIFTGEGTIIHSYEGSGKVIENRLDDRWQRKIVGVYRYV